MQYGSQELQVLGKEDSVITKPRDKPKNRNTPEPKLWVVSQNSQEVWGTRVLILVVASEAAISVLVPQLSGPLRVEVSFLPQFLMGLVALLVILNLRQRSQRKSLRDVSKALMDSIAYIERLEEYSFIDPETHTFHRSYLNHLFRQESQSSNRRGNMTTMCLFEVRSDENGSSASAETIQSAASMLRSNFRGSDYIVHYSIDQFLVLMCDTNDQQARFALNRLNKKVEIWNLENDKPSIMLRQQMSICQPGEDLWEKLRAMKQSMENETAAWSGPAYIATEIATDLSEPLGY